MVSDLIGAVNADRLLMLGLARGMGSHWVNDDDASLSMTADVVESLSNEQCRNLVVVGAQLLSAAWRTIASDMDNYNAFMDSLWKQWSDGSS